MYQVFFFFSISILLISEVLYHFWHSSYLHQRHSQSNVLLTSNISSGEQLHTEIENECLHLPHTQSLSMAVESDYFRLSCLHHHYNNFQCQLMLQPLFFQEILESFGPMIFNFFSYFLSRFI